MNKQPQHKFCWQQVGAIAIAMGAMSIVKAPAVANPYNQDSFEIAQVGVRSQINAPTPLNITPPPGTHIPLPESNYNNRDYYDDPRGSSRYIPYEDYRRENDYRRDYGYHRRDTYERNRSRGGTVIIINPATESSYSNSYIRVIRK